MRTVEPADVQQKGASPPEHAPQNHGPLTRARNFSRRSTFQAVAHELLALVAFELLVAGFLVARFHFFLLRRLLARVLAFQARAHELLARVALELLVAGFRVAILHSLLLLLLLFRGLLLG